jgi:hypothetical protein
MSVRFRLEAESTRSNLLQLVGSERIRVGRSRVPARREASLMRTPQVGFGGCTVRCRWQRSSFGLELYTCSRRRRLGSARFGSEETPAPVFDDSSKSSRLRKPLSNRKVQAYGLEEEDGSEFKCSCPSRIRPRSMKILEDSLDSVLFA